MEKTKYRYKCMICGTEVISTDDMLSCSACGSDELAKFEIASAIDVVEKKSPKKRSHRSKLEPSSASNTDILSIIEDRDLAEFVLKSIPPYRKPPLVPPLPPPPPPPPPPLPPPPQPTKWERIRSFMTKVSRRILSEITPLFAIGGVIYGVPLVIGGVIYYILKFFI